MITLNFPAIEFSLQLIFYSLGNDYKECTRVYIKSLLMRDKIDNPQLINK
jgi:hypothetical protein